MCSASEYLFGGDEDSGWVEFILAAKAGEKRSRQEMKMLRTREEGACAGDVLEVGKS